MRLREARWIGNFFKDFFLLKILFTVLFILFIPFFIEILFNFVDFLLDSLFSFYYEFFIFQYFFYLIDFPFFFIKNISLNILQYFYFGIDQRYNLVYSDFLSRNQLPHNFSIYHHPKYSVLHLAYNLNEEKPIVKEGNKLDLRSHFFNFLTTSRFFNFSELDFFFLFGFFIVISTLIGFVFFIGLEVVSLETSTEEENLSDDISGETTSDIFSFQDFASYPRTNFHYANIQSDLYPADQRHPEWLIYSKNFHQEFNVLAFDREYDQVSIYMLMEDIEDEYLSLRNGSFDGNGFSFDIVFFLRFNVLYPVSRFFLNLFPFSFLFSFFAFVNPTRFLFSIIYWIIFFFIVFRYFLLLLLKIFFFVICFVLLFTIFFWFFLINK